MSLKYLRHAMAVGIASISLIAPMVLGGVNSTVASARRRPRTHRVAPRHHKSHRSHRSHKRTGRKKGRKRKKGKKVKYTTKVRKMSSYEYRIVQKHRKLMRKMSKAQKRKFQKQMKSSYNNQFNQMDPSVSYESPVQKYKFVRHPNDYYVYKYPSTFKPRVYNDLTKIQKKIYNKMNTKQKIAFVHMSATDRANYVYDSKEMRRVLINKTNRRLVDAGVEAEDGQVSKSRKAYAKQVANEKYQRHVKASQTLVLNADQQLNSLVAQRQAGNHSRSLQKKINKAVDRVQYAKDKLNEIHFGDPLAYYNSTAFSKTFHGGWFAKPEAPKPVNYSGLSLNNLFAN